jgi:murein hydrolase activator
MQRFLFALLCLSPLLLGGLFAAGQAHGQAAAQLSAEVEESQEELSAARARAAEARSRADALLDKASAAQSEAERTAAEREALSAEVEEAEADLDAANARIAVLEDKQRGRRARLSRLQGPMAKLIAALQSYARRPAIFALTQPKAISDIVHLRAIVQSIGPQIDRRTAAIRTEIARERRFQAQELVARNALAEASGTLDERRERLAVTEAGQRAEAGRIAREAEAEQLRAYNLGERARDIVEAGESRPDAQALATRLAALPPPKMRGAANGAADTWLRPKSVYRLPVNGRLLIGLGEATDFGYRARGLTIKPAGTPSVVAPAGGKVVFAGRYRSFGDIIIIDHGAGWTTLLTGLNALTVDVGQMVVMGAAVGSPDPASEGVTVELRRAGRPVDIIALLD